MTRDQLEGMTDDELRAAYLRRQRAADVRELRPYLDYQAHERGQLQFHQAPHIFRCLWPGNGFGKTTAAGIEAAWWIFHAHPYQTTPAWPVIVIWAAETYKQFEILRQQLESDCLGPQRSWRHPDGWKFNKTDRCYTFADGARLFLISGDGSWTHIQGINPDLVLYDEEPPLALHAEMKMRRRGKRKTRYCFAATATQGLTWMYHQLYAPWLKFHSDRGYNEIEAVRQNIHPLIWAWPLGGIDDNPGADAEDRAYYRVQEFSSDAEKRVRLKGGFGDFAGKPVFDMAALEVLERGVMAGQSGTFLPLTGPDHQPVPGRFQWIADGEDDLGRVTIFAPPDLRRTRYVMGFDSAYGLRDGDFDYAVVLDRNTGEQVAEAQGRWGDVRWCTILAALHFHYGRAFLCGERQVGLVAMRRLYDEMGVTYQYFNRQEASRARRRSDTLGHHRMAGDLVIRNLRKAIAPRDMHGRLHPSEIVVRSPELLRQLIKFQFAPKSQTKDEYDRHDADYRMGAPPGDHDDGVMAMTYANLARLEVQHYVEPPEPFAPGTFGATFDMDERLGVKKKRGPKNPFARD